jgi:hypothetical protein
MPAFLYRSLLSVLQNQPACLCTLQILAGVFVLVICFLNFCAGYIWLPGRKRGELHGIVIVK